MDDSKHLHKVSASFVAASLCFARGSAMCPAGVMAIYPTQTRGLSLMKTKKLKAPSLEPSIMKMSLGMGGLRIAVST